MDEDGDGDSDSDDGDHHEDNNDVHYGDAEDSKMLMSLMMLITMITKDLGDNGDDGGDGGGDGDDGVIMVVTVSYCRDVITLDRTQKAWDIFGVLGIPQERAHTLTWPGEADLVIISEQHSQCPLLATRFPQGTLLPGARPATQSIGSFSFFRSSQLILGIRSK